MMQSMYSWFLAHGVPYNGLGLKQRDARLANGERWRADDV